MPLLNRIGKGAGALVGLGQEAFAHHRDKSTGSDSPPDSSSDKIGEIVGAHSEQPLDQSGSYSLAQNDLDRQGDDVHSNLHEAGLGSACNNNERSKSAIDWFTNRHPQNASTINVKAQLPAPVVIPQRRPGTRARGFVRAYAPDLENSGVSQAQFLDFIDGFDRQTTENQGYFNAVNIALGLSSLSTLGFYTGSMAVWLGSVAVQLSVQGASKAYMNKKSNEYLDRMNEIYFRPRGLYAMIMKYDPSSGQEKGLVDFETSTSAAIGNREESSRKQQYKTASGRTVEDEIPETCSLIFPDIDKVTDEKQENAFQRSLAFTKDYVDRRAQASFAAQNPDSTLNAQQPEFAGRYADPTTFEKSGPLGVLTGGLIDPTKRRMERRERKRAGSRDDASAPQRRGPISTARQRLHTGILYLLVVNMPTEAELKQAQDLLEKTRDH